MNAGQRSNLGLGVITGAALIVVGCLLPWKVSGFGDPGWQGLEGWWGQLALMFGIILGMLGISALRTPDVRRVWLASLWAGAVCLVVGIGSAVDASRTMYFGEWLSEYMDLTDIGTGLIAVVTGSLVAIGSSVVGLRRAGGLGPLP